MFDPHRNPSMHRQLVVLAVAAISACSPPETPPTPAGVQTREVTYTQGNTTLKGYMAWDAGRTAPRPGVLVVHEWWGHNEHARAQARRLAEAGYVGFAVDMFGDGKSTTHPDSAQQFIAQALSDLPALVARFQAALGELKADPHVDSTKVGAIGYCFGGAVVLSRALAGDDLDAVASFHGAMPPDMPADSGGVKARVLILTGGADPMVPAAQVDSTASRLRRLGATVDVVTYPGAMHSFTNPRADSVGMKELKYDAGVDRQSWDELLKLLAGVFGAG
jgi:dienelactone hydrolase